MSRLDDYRIALRAADENVSTDELRSILHARGSHFARLVIDSGLGPLWHSRTDSPEFRDNRLAAEAHFVVQEHALREIDLVLSAEGIQYAVFKGAANRLLLYQNAAIRSCHDLDLLVHPEDRVTAARALVAIDFEAHRNPAGISRGLELVRGPVGIDLHWGLLREGRLSTDITGDLLSCRRRVGDVWMLDSEGALFVLLVHPAFAKHLGSSDMGLNRVLDVILWLRAQKFDWSIVKDKLRSNGVRTAAWATLSWVDLLSGQNTPGKLSELRDDLRPGIMRAAWLHNWLEQDFSNRARRWHWARLLGLSLFLHDSLGDSIRALRGRYRAYRRQKKDLAAFGDLLD